MNIRYQRTPRHSYMIIGGTPREDDYQWKMLKYNQPGQLLPFQHMVTEHAGEFWYEVSGMQTLEQKYTLEAADRETLSHLLEQICRMEEELEQFMLEDIHVSFAPARVFYHKLKGRYLFCYIPDAEMSEDDSLQFLLEWMLGHIDHKDAEASALGYGIYEQCMHDTQAVFQWKHFLKQPEVQARISGKEYGTLRTGDLLQPENSYNYTETKLSSKWSLSQRAEPDHAPCKEKHLSARDDDGSAYRVPGTDGDTLTENQFPGDDRIYFTESGQEPGKGLFRHRKKKSKRTEKPEKTGKMKKTERAEKPEKSGKRFHLSDKNDSDGKHFRFGEKQKKEFEFPELPEEIQPLVSDSAAPFGAMSGGQETTYLDPRPVMRCWKLIYRGDGLEQDLELSEFPYRIGKEVSTVQGVLKAETVSRLHAQITAEESDGGLSGLFLWDYNSTNGTYLNGELIPMNTPMPLAEHDHIVFATEEFVLRRVVGICR